VRCEELGLLVQGLEHALMDRLVIGQQGARSLVPTLERHQLEEQYHQAQKMESVGRLAGGTAHDFNNHLTVINSYASFVAEELRKGDPLLDDLEQIQAAGQRAAHLTRQLLAFSRKQVLQPKLVNLNAIIIDLEKMLMRLIGEDIEIQTVLAEELGDVFADPGQLEQVLMNLSITAANAGEAILECEKRSNRIQLVLTDVIMPKLSGRELAERLKVMCPGLRVLFMSGYTDDAIVHHGVLEAGTHFIAKPFDSQDLLRKVRESLEARERRS
jgi:signal transduction histidine kinase